eukprot:TRINITY_DN89775_c0_g1_i1.p1 TRINITY_DN89775_c0_g1~~TRINITY_DN89775_c0_g1_i1.p1  ORF type:complete len:562 (-),score=79.11 TRINITY_DN89775_c0_g1_i1:165-1787(-)
MPCRPPSALQQLFQWLRHLLTAKRDVQFRLPEQESDTASASQGMGNIRSGQHRCGKHRGGNEYNDGNAVQVVLEEGTDFGTPRIQNSHDMIEILSVASDSSRSRSRSRSRSPPLHCPRDLWNPDRPLARSLHESRSSAQVAFDDDDSDNQEKHMIVSKTQCADELDALSRKGQLSFSTQSVLVSIECLRAATSTRTVTASRSLVMHLTGGKSPATATGLRSGRVVSLEATECDCKLIRMAPEGEHPGSSHFWLLVRGNTAFFNFLRNQWQPMSKLCTYLPGRKVLYCAFTPHGSSLFVKLGYRSLGQQGDAALLGYLEKKSRLLKLTNNPGAGLFVLPLPKDHEGLADPARAAEESLKSAVRNSAMLSATPSGHQADVTAFSHSLEYFFVAARQPDYSPLQALTAVLQGFSGDCELRPRRAVAKARDPWRQRAGRKRLVAWPEDELNPSTACSSAQACLAKQSGLVDSKRSAEEKPFSVASVVPRPPSLAVASSLRSRQKIRAAAAALGAFGRRASRRHLAARLTTQFAKRRRLRAKSCP